MKRADLKAKMEKFGMEVNNELIDFILDESLKNVRETYKDMFDLKPGAQILNPSPTVENLTTAKIEEIYF